ncbi:MAG: iron donor protein CyaY [Azovibrio sp.]|nr:iron donor protein CyaY [Azovibrio sp.]
MDERDFARHADAAFAHIEAVLEAADEDVEFELAPGGVLEIVFANGSKMVINRHAIAREIWVAAKSGGFHFRWNGEDWVDTRSGEPLMAALTRLVQAQAGLALAF